MTSICIDAMGGDFGPQPIIGGVIEALKEVKFEAVLVGDTKILESLIPHNFKQYVKFIQADEVVSMNEGATDALKRKESSYDLSFQDISQIPYHRNNHQTLKYL